MSTKSLVVAAIGAATVVAAGAGTFMASRTSLDRPCTSDERHPRPSLRPARGDWDVGRRSNSRLLQSSAAARPDAPSTETAGGPGTTRMDAGSPAAAGSSRRSRPRRVSEPVGQSVSIHRRLHLRLQARSRRRRRTCRLRPVAAPRRRPPPPDPPKPTFEEVTVKEDAVIGIRLENAVSSETAKVEDRVTARVSRDVTVEGRTAIPAGALLEGTVTAGRTRRKVQGTRADRHSIHDARAGRQLAAADSDGDDFP